MRRLAILRIDGIGDYVLFRNFIEVIKTSKKYQDYHITLIGNELWKDIAIKFDERFVDKFIWIDIQRFSINRVYRRLIFLSLKFHKFDVLISPTYSRRFYFEDDLVKRIKSQTKIGHNSDLSNLTIEQKKRSNLYYDFLIFTDKKVFFEFNRNKQFINKLIEANSPIDSPYFKLRTTSSKPYIIIFPGAGERFRMWDSSKYLNLLREINLISKSEIKICGSKSDYIIGQEIIDGVEFKKRIKNYCGKLSLDQLVIQARNSYLIITNDTGMAHIAASIGTKCVCISNANHFGRFNPYPSNISSSIKYVYPNQVDQLDLDQKIQFFSYGSDININSISVKKVLSKLLQYNLLQSDFQ